ncbi:LLM class flavin-dependent oxidoreductase [Staphylococcus gallinarum]|uniref:LLM class flavin-dependent oxidoreductase n=1 Tax=Staphylococcus gallinarum TaxID=1293 RepID=UPI001E3AEA97|nr:LLM class flavin-dependent oxidoreductase [Staphylococcus gallinarum]
MKLSILDYVPIFQDCNATEAFNHAIELVQLAEQLNYERYWVAEHHQVYSVASSAPEMVMMALLEQTQSIQIGSGGVMLAHYSPYKVAEQFNIMEARHPKRINIGTGHSPSFKNVNKALNEHKSQPVDYETQIEDLIQYFNGDTQLHRFKNIAVTPKVDTKPLMFILGMSKNSASLAAKEGLPFVIALMGQPASQVANVITHYRQQFAALHPQRQSYVIISTFVVTADNQETINDLETALHYWLLRINYIDQPQFYASPQYVKNRPLTNREQEKMLQNKKRVISGTPSAVYAQLQNIQDQYGADEIMIQPHVYGEENRKQLLQLIANENKKST